MQMNCRLFHAVDPHCRPSLRSQALIRKVTRYSHSLIIYSHYLIVVFITHAHTLTHSHSYSIVVFITFNKYLIAISFLIVCSAVIC